MTEPTAPMPARPDEPAGQRGRGRLLLTIPAALAVTVLAGFLMTVAWCGVSGCSGGGFGRISEPGGVEVAVVAVLLCGVWIGALSPMTAPRARWWRWGLIVVLAGLVTVATMMVSTSGFVR